MPRSDGCVEESVHARRSTVTTSRIVLTIVGRVERGNSWPTPRHRYRKRLSRKENSMCTLYVTPAEWAAVGPAVSNGDTL